MGGDLKSKVGKRAMNLILDVLWSPVPLVTSSYVAGFRPE